MSPLDDGSLFHIWIILNGYHRTSTSSSLTSTTTSICVCHHSCSEVFILLKLWALLQRRRRRRRSSTTLFWGLQKPQRDLYNLLVISGLRIGPNLITASALDSMLSSPKVKVKVSVSHKISFSFYGLTVYIFLYFYTCVICIWEVQDYLKNFVNCSCYSAD